MQPTPAQMISEYSRMLSQLLCDVMEHDYLLKNRSSQLTKTQFSILKILNTSGSFLGSELSKILNISRPAITKNIDKLVKLKMASRKNLKNDRRTTEISLLKAGRDFVSGYEKVRMEKQKLALQSLSNKEQQLLSELLAKYVRSCMAEEKMLDVICLQCNDVIMDECMLINHENKCRYFHKLEEKSRSLSK